MPSSLPDSASNSEPEAIPESPATLPSLPEPPLSLPEPPSLYDAIPELLSLYNAIPESSTRYTFPLPPLDQLYDTPEQGIAAINAFGARMATQSLYYALKRQRKASRRPYTYAAIAAV
jgi:hypothetical protein